MLQAVQNFLRDSSGAMTVNFTVLGASLIGLGLSSVAVVSLGATNLGSRFEDGVTGAGTVVLCMFSNENDCAGGGDDGGGTNDDGQGSITDELTGSVTIGSVELTYSILALTDREAEQLVNMIRLNSADQVISLIEQVNSQFYTDLNAGDIEAAAKMLDYYYLAIQVLGDRYEYEAIAEAFANDFKSSLEYFATGSGRVYVETRPNFSGRF